MIEGAFECQQKEKRNSEALPTLIEELPLKGRHLGPKHCVSSSPEVQESA